MTRARIEAKLDIALQEMFEEVSESCGNGLRLEDIEDTEVIEVSAGLLCAVKEAFASWREQR